VHRRDAEQCALDRAQSAADRSGDCAHDVIGLNPRINSEIESPVAPVFPRILRASHSVKMRGAGLTPFFQYLAAKRWGNSSHAHVIFLRTRTNERAAYPARRLTHLVLVATH